MQEQLAARRLLQRICHLQTHNHRHANGDFIHYRWRRYSKRLADRHRRTYHHQLLSAEWPGGNFGDDYGNRLYGDDQGDVWGRGGYHLHSEFRHAVHGDLVACRSEFVTADAAGGVRVLPLDGPSIGGVGVDIAAELAS